MMLLSDYYNANLIRLRETKDKFNEVESSQEITFSCRIEVSNKNLSNKSGKDIMSNFLIFTSEESDIVETDKIKYNGKTYEIIVISHEQSFIQSHKEIYI
jgi:hypothetical protein